jgi:hypothetical protein
MSFHLCRACRKYDACVSEITPWSSKRLMRCVTSMLTRARRSEKPRNCGRETDKDECARGACVDADVKQYHTTNASFVLSLF